MEDKFRNIEDVTAKFLAGEATQEEIQFLNVWKSQSDENAKEFSDFEKLFKLTSNAEYVSVDTDLAWKRVRKGMIKKEGGGKVIRIRLTKRVSPLLRIAAVFLLVAGIGISIFFMFRNNENNFVHFDSGNSIKNISLPDGSKLTLNKNSTITFEQNSFSKKRTIKLKGEAFFNVKHDSLSPFIVEMGKLIIEDIGTAFNVNQKTDFIIVSVTEGKVELSSSNKNSVLLSEGEEVAYNIKTNEIESPGAIGENLTAYKDKVFVFENAELGKIVDVLNGIYDTQLQLENDELKNCRITVSFNNEDINDIATIISETLGLTQKNSEGKIILGGDGCK